MARRTTEHIGPVVAEPGKQAHARAHGVIERPASEIREAFVRNLVYFWIGRFSGVIPYFFPVAFGAVLFLLAGPRGTRGWLALATLLVSGLAYLALIPDNWYGGGGTVGNRYFLNLLPLALFLIPVGSEWVVAATGALATLVFLGPALASPVAHSLHPWQNALRQPLRVFPLELTMLNDLGFCSDPWRKKQPFGDAEGDARRAKSADPHSYWLYFPDDGTYGKEVVAGREGFWLRRGQRAELVLRALSPVDRIVVHMDGGPEGDIVGVRAGGLTKSLPLGPHERREEPIEPGRPYEFYLSYVYTLKIESRGAPQSELQPKSDARRLGAFVQLQLELADGAPSHVRLHEPGFMR